MYSKFEFLVILIFLFTVSKINAQEINFVSLGRFIDTSIRNGGHMQTQKIDNNGLYNVGNYDDYIIKEFYFQPVQFYNSQWEKKRVNQSMLNLYEERYKEKAGIFCIDSINNKIQILISLDAKNNKTIIFDLNHNQNFTDDSAYIFIRETEKEKIRVVARDLPVIKIPIAYCLPNMKSFFDTIFIRPYPYPSAFTYTDSIENRYYLMIENAMAKKGFLNINGDNYSVIVSSGRPLPLYNLPYTKIFINDSENNNNRVEYYEIGDTVKIKNGAIRLDSVTKFGDTLFYKSIFTKDIFDLWKTKIPNMKLTDIYGEKRYIWFDKKVTLIDFWGSWCKPCIANIPKLKSLYKKLKSKKFQIVSIAFEDKRNIIKLRKIVKKEKINWVNIFQNIDDESASSLVKKFKVINFPTFILVDEKGNIIVRSSDTEDNFEMIIDKLNHLFRLR